MDDAVLSDGFQLVVVPSLDIHFAEQCDPTTILTSAAIAASTRSTLVTLNGTVAGQQYVVIIAIPSATNVQLREGPIDYTSLHPGQLEQRFVITASQKDATIDVAFVAARTATVTVSACVAPLAAAAGDDHIRVSWDPQAVDAPLRSVLSASVQLQLLVAGTWSTIVDALLPLSIGSHTFIPTTSFASGAYRSRLQLCAGSVCNDSPSVSALLAIRNEEIVFADVLPVLVGDTLTLTWASPTLPYSGLYRWALVSAVDGSKQLVGWQAEAFGMDDSQRATRTLTIAEQTQVAAAHDIYVVIEVLLLEGMEGCYRAYLLVYCSICLNPRAPCATCCCCVTVQQRQCVPAF
jgi:hypothetical protein